MWINEDDEVPAQQVTPAASPIKVKEQSRFVTPSNKGKPIETPSPHKVPKRESPPKVPAPQKHVSFKGPSTPAVKFKGMKYNPKQPKEQKGDIRKW